MDYDNFLTPAVLTDSNIAEILSPLKCVELLEAYLADRNFESISTREYKKVCGQPHVFSWGHGCVGNEIYYGFRCYSGRQSHSRHIDVSTLYRGSDGSLVALHIGRELSAWRNGAAGALAIRSFFEKDEPLNILVVGAGLQAYAQLACIAESMNIATVRVASRTAHSERQFSNRCKEELHLDVRCTATSIDPSRANVLICATSEGHRIIDPSLLCRRVHINAIGPKLLGCSELGREVYSMMEHRVCDNLPQLAEDWRTLEASASLLSMNDFQGLGSTAHYSHERSLFLCRGVVGFEIELLAWAHKNRLREYRYFQQSTESNAE